ncbi:unnamed protein product [Parnassius mnemosyne]|uniref:DDE Tnp4 domain-containing protein n=1 Tax=Parnassius mnemosyne TaxID=213953 RepID=A0AAV1LCY5_9NEOP
MDLDSSDEEIYLLARLLEIEHRKRKRKRKQIWVKHIWKNRLIHGEFHTIFEELKRDSLKFYEYYRMEYWQFLKLTDLLRVHITKKTTNYRCTITAEERLTVTLRFLITGCSFKNLSFNFRMGISTVHSIIHETIRVICDVLMPIVMQMPDEEMWEKVSRDFFNIWNFPNCLGAIDGKHVNIQAPDNSGSLYNNYKNFFSTVLLAVVDAKYSFLIVDVGSYGKNSDGGILQNSKFWKKLNTNKLKLPPNKPLPSTTESLPHVFIGDEAFPLSNNILRPYPREQARTELSKKVFNLRLSRARKVVECAFGMLTQRFEIYQKRMKIQPKYCDLIILATTCLHNFLIENRTPGQENEFHSNINLLTAITDNNNENSSNSDAVLTTRNKFKDYFSSSGALDWQDQVATRVS